MDIPGAQPDPANRTPRFPILKEFQTIGSSLEGRPLVVHYCGDPASTLRIFILAGQHGDEPGAREAAAEYLRKCRSGDLRTGAHLAILVDANPDGSAARTRRNASDIDLNRDHLALDASETLAVHCFVDSWQPNLVIDVHTYRPSRPELLQFDFVFPHEVMVDFPTHPAICTGMRHGRRIGLLDFIKFRLMDASFRCERYTLVRPSGIVRHSSMNIIDARNGLALRYGMLTVLLEGRRATPDDPPVGAPSQLALLLSIEAVVEWAVGNAHLIQLRASNSRCLDRIPVRCRYTSSKTPRYMEMQSANGGDIQFVNIPGAYLPFVTATRTVLAPTAYAVPKNLVSLLEILRKQRFLTTSMDRAVVETYRLLQPPASPSEPDADASVPPPRYSRERILSGLDDFVLFPTDQPGGRALALFLELESQFRPDHLFDFTLSLGPGMQYPILRVI